MFVTPLGHAAYAVMLPQHMKNLTTAFAKFGTSHTESPSNTPPWNA
jgi:hypothetical protein